WHLSQRPPLPRCGTIGSAPSRSAHRGARLWLAARSLGRVFEPLSLRRALATDGGGRDQLGVHARTSSRKDCQVAQSSRCRAQPVGLAQLLGDTPHVREVLSGATQLRSSESGEASAGAGGQSVSVVFGG